MATVSCLFLQVMVNVELKNAGKKMSCAWLQ